MELQKSGFLVLYVRREDESNLKVYLQLAKLPQIQKSMAPQERINAIDHLGAEFLKCVYEGQLTVGTVEKAKSLAAEISSCIQEDPGSIRFLQHLVDHDAYTYRHSIRVATYAVAISIGLGVTEEGHLREVALGGIFHDIGKKEVSLDLLNKPGSLNEGEWEILRCHPKVGWIQIKNTILSHVPREIVLHHHEKRNGSGYPDGLDRHSLLMEVQVATLADIFDALTSNRSYQNRRTHFQALSFIKDRLLTEEVSLEAFKALVGVLAK
jgi:HD-GYP domain-containing protein (c-di-GMP phosphodiesterase class II)